MTDRLAALVFIFAMLPGPAFPVTWIESAGGSPVAMMTVGVSGEFGTNARTPLADGGSAEYKYPFGEGAAGSEATQTTDEAFAIVPIAGTFRAIRLYNHDGGMGATQELRLTLQECAVADGLTGCTWSDTSVTETAEGAAGTADTTWTTTGLSATVTAGDVFTMKIDNPATTGSDIPEGSSESVNYLLEFESTNDDESFLTATYNKSSGSGVYFPITGTVDSNFTDQDDVVMTMPGSFTLTALYGARTTTTNARYIALCDRDGVGDDTSCGGTNAGTELARCSFSASDDACETTGLSVSLDTGSDLFYAFEQNFEVFNHTIGMALESANQEWVSGTCHGVNAETDDSTYGGFGQSGMSPSQFGYYCNDNTASQFCETAVISEVVAKHMVGHAGSTPAADANEEWNVIVVEDGTASALSCDMAQNDTTCTGTTDVTIEADNTFMFEFDSVGTTEAVAHCTSTLWGSM